MTVFPKFSSGGGCVIEPAILQSLTTPSCQPGGDHYPPRASLGSFYKSPPTNRILAGKRGLVEEKCQIRFLNKVLPCDEAPFPAPCPKRCSELDVGESALPVVALVLGSHHPNPLVSVDVPRQAEPCAIRT